MPRKEPQNDKIIRALESRKARADALRQQQGFRLGRAIRAIQALPKNITAASQLRRLEGITDPIFQIIENVLNGTEDVEVPLPTPRQIDRAQQTRGQLLFDNPPAPGTGGWGILVCLYQEALKPNGAAYMTKSQLINTITARLNIHMADQQGGFGRWNNIKSLERKHWVLRDARRSSFPGTGRALGGGRRATQHHCSAGIRAAAAAAASGLFNEEERDYVTGRGGAFAAGSDNEWDMDSGPDRQGPAAGAPGTGLLPSSGASRAKAISTPGTASGSDGLMAGLLPRVTKAQMPEPLCRSGCDACQSLVEFVGNAAALELPMLLPSKKMQQHVSKVVGWLASPPGGRHHLSCIDGTGRKSVIVRKQQQQRNSSGAGCAGDSQQNPVAAARLAPGHHVEFELKLVVDDCERHADSNPNQLYSSLRQDHVTKLVPALPAGTTVKTLMGAECLLGAEPGSQLRLPLQDLVASRSSVIADEAQLCDFIIRVSVSEFGGNKGQRVARRLPRDGLPFELRNLPPAPVVPPALSFSVTAGQGQFGGLQLYDHRSYPLQIVVVQGKQLLQLLDGFYAAAAAAQGLEGQQQLMPETELLVPDTEEQQVEAAAASGGSKHWLPVMQAVPAALEVAVLLSSLLEAFVGHAAGTEGGGSSTARASKSEPCKLLLVENLLGARSALELMIKAQADAQLGYRRATKRAADQQAQMCGLQGTVIQEHLHLWLLCFVLKQGWHCHLAQTAAGAGLFLEAAGSRCCWLAEHGPEQVQLQRPLSQQQQGKAQEEEEEAGDMDAEVLLPPGNKSNATAAVRDKLGRAGAAAGLAAAACTGVCKRPNPDAVVADGSDVDVGHVIVLD
eukprot:gene7490-7699_t